MRVLSRKKFLHLTRLAYLIIPAFAALVTVMEPSSASNGGGILSLATIAMSMFAWMAGGMAVADSVSSEKRDGTLGLLMMTPLSSYEILIAKSLSSSLNFFLAVLGMIPFFGLLILMGGIQPMDLFLSVVSIFSCYFLSNSLGLLVSVNTYAPREAWLYTMITLLVAGLCFPLYSWLLSLNFKIHGQWINPLWAGYWFSYDSNQVEYKSLGNIISVIPIYKLVSYQIAGAIGLGLALVALAGFTLNLAWKREKDARQKSGKLYDVWSDIRQKLAQPIEKKLPGPNRGRRDSMSGSSEISDDMNPVAWFWGRNLNLPLRVLLIFGLLESVFVALLITIFVMWDHLSLGKAIRIPSFEPLWGQHLYLYIVAGLVITDLFFKYMASLQIIRKTIEDKSNGGMEMLLTTPVSDIAMSEGIPSGIHDTVRRYKLASVISFTVLGVTLLFMFFNMVYEDIFVLFLGLFSLFIGITNILDWRHLVRIGVILALKNKSIPGSANKAWLLCCLLPTLFMSLGFFLVATILNKVSQSYDVPPTTIALSVSILTTPQVLGIQILNHYLSYRALLQFEFFRDAFQKYTIGRQ